MQILRHVSLETEELLKEQLCIQDGGPGFNGVRLKVFFEVKELNLSYHNRDSYQILRFLSYGSLI